VNSNVMLMMMRMIATLFSGQDGFDVLGKWFTTTTRDGGEHIMDQDRPEG
jgi:hypothetical protein